MKKCASSDLLNLVVKLGWLALLSFAIYFFVDRIFFLFRLVVPKTVSLALGQCRLANSTVNPSQVAWFHFTIAWHQVSLTGNIAAAWWYVIRAEILGKSCALFAKKTMLKYFFHLSWFFILNVKDRETPQFLWRVSQLL